MKKQNRRSFLQFLGRTGVGLGASAFLVNIQACTPTEKPKDSILKAPKSRPFPLQDIQHSLEDKLVLTNGLEYDILIKWNDPISETDQFGFNNDYLAFVPFDKNNPNDGMLWVNHEYFQELFINGNSYDDKSKKTKETVDTEMYSVGGSLVRIRKNDAGKWEIVLNDEHNRRLTAKTEIPFHWDEPIQGSTSAIGTFANCSGGVTPWGTILTCEENYDMFYGETDHSDPKKPFRNLEHDYYGWSNHYDYPPEHYGWVVEVNPLTGEAKKLVALGRCAHECATVHETKDGRLVVYSGDDSNNECLYKFISNKPKNLKDGKLYVANTTAGKWISLDYDDQEILRQNFANQTEVLIRLREAAKLVGGTPLNRPEDIEIDPITGHVLVALTNNKPEGDYLGEILKIVETDLEDKTSLTFMSSTFLAGGEDTGFACPDNMAFDPKGNLWFTSDISGSSINSGPYLPFGNNGLFLIPSWGDQKGKVIQIASAPVDAEFTGPFFAPDGETLFLSIQHPGERSKDLENLTSHWPEGGTAQPKPSVVCISGQGLKDLMQGEF
ncbi:MAG: DUF839 domain-containing protein [Aureispira sp.]|nr:DUF839 domain-containing protein [Aureispira sp.]